MRGEGNGRKEGRKMIEGEMHEIWGNGNGGRRKE